MSISTDFIRTATQCIIALFLFTIFTSCPAAAQDSVDGRSEKPVPSDAVRVPYRDLETAEKLWNAFERKYGGDWRHDDNPRTGLPQTISGCTRRYRGTPVDVARTFLEENKALLGVAQPGYALHYVETEESDFVFGGVKLVFQQRYQGIDVWLAEIAVIVDDDKRKRCLRIISSVWPVEGVATTPRLTAGAVLQTIQQQHPGESVVVTEGPRLVIVRSGAGQLAYLAFVNVVGQHERLGSPWLYVVDALTGEILEGRSLVLQ